MAGWTNRGKLRALGALFNAVALPTNFFAFLATSAIAPTQDTNTKADVTEVPAGNGYTTGGLSLTKNTTDFPGITEDDTNDWAEIRIKDLVWTATGGNLPSTAARYVLLSDDNATQASREIWAYGDLGADRQVSVGQALTLQNWFLRFTQ